MALQVWLPFTDGTLKQQGLNNASVTVGGTVNLTNAGKLGKCATIGTAAGGITLPASTMTSFTECSVAFWIKIISWNTSYATFFQAGLGSTPWNNYIFGILRNNANSNLCFTLTNSSSSSTNASYVTSNLSTGQWYHLAFTYKAGTISSYIDGELDKSYSTTYVPNFAGITHISIGRSTNNSNYQTNCSLNDFRIYDHALSQMEVKELAKGLVLHYPLNGGGLLGSQYDSTIYVEPDGSLWTHIFHHNNPASARFNSTDSFATGVYLDVNRWYDVEQLCNLTTKWEFMLKEKLTSTSTENKYRWIQTVNPNTATWNDVKPDSTNITRITTSGYNTNTNSGGMWRYNKNTRMVLANSSSSNWYGAIGAWVNYSNAIPGRYDGTDVKCSTGYEDLYLRIDNCPVGIKSTIEYDCSGFCNNGLKTGTFNWINDTPKYQVSTIFENNRIMNDSTFLLSQQNHVTLAAWVKLTAYTNDRSMIALVNQFYLTIDSSGRLSGYAYGKNPEGYHNSNSTIPLNKWTHIAIVWDDSSIKFYINGQLDKSITSTGTSTSTVDYQIRIGQEAANRQVKGNLSDIRTYATALSASDVKSLYQNSAYIDSSGNVYGAVHSEV